ncbi:hypothetical protein KIN20_036512 [Parelaphostrongylus tenuis]|uniref:Uncharacterized protein n=1 Tax=Parelaphostrongylus tenuis TaxID=148309 RepID=A0AAD5RD14_PARTN|nr:hypothetical protein KIN20_036512 [Parelaphostrongylus tenuis]
MTNRCGAMAKDYLGYTKRVQYEQLSCFLNCGELALIWRQFAVSRGIGDLIDPEQGRTGDLTYNIELRL